MFAVVVRFLRWAAVAALEKEFCKISTWPKRGTKMKLSTFVFMITAVAFVSFSGVASAQQYPPVWNDLMTLSNCNSPSFDANCGNYFPLGSNPPNNLLNIALNQLPVPNTIALASNVTSLPDPGTYSWTCGSQSEPVTFIETGRASGITGVGFLGTFNDSNGPLGVNQYPYYLSGNMFEAVFFNENQCYGPNGLGGNDASGANGREYGFFLATSDDSIWAYWGFQENVGGIQVQMQLNSASNSQTPENGAATPVAGQKYYYEMYPGPDFCTFTIHVFNWFNTVTPIYIANVPVNGNSFTVTNSSNPVDPITNANADPGFCSAITSDTGYVSANVNPAGVSGSVPSSGLTVYIERLLAGTI